MFLRNEAPPPRHDLGHGAPVVTCRVERPVGEQPHLVSGKAAVTIRLNLRLRAGDRPHAHIRKTPLERFVVPVRVRRGLAGRRAAQGDASAGDGDKGLRVGPVLHAVHVDDGLVRGGRVEHGRHVIPRIGLQNGRARRPTVPTAVKRPDLAARIGHERASAVSRELSEEPQLAG